MAISTQYQNLNLIPGKSAPVVVHCSQGNVGDTVGFYLYDGDEPFYPTNVSIAVHGVRADGSVFGPYAVAVTSGSNLVTFELVTAMTSVAGAAIGELVISDSEENRVGTANFGILVEATPYSSTVTYEDDLSIYQRILAYVQSMPAELRAEFDVKIGWCCTPEMFGAVGDGVTDDTKALQDAIEFAENANVKCTLLLNKTYLTSTLHISKPLAIYGRGKLKAVPYAYTTLAENIAVGATSMKVADPSAFHVNQTFIIGIDLLVVVGIEDNRISFEHSPLNNPTNGTRVAHNAGERIELLNTLLFITKNIVFDPSDIEPNKTAGISGVTIEGIELEGNTSGYNVDYYNAYEGFGGYLAIFFRSEHCVVKNIKFHDGALMGIAFIGYTNANEVFGCVGYNFDGLHYGSAIDTDRKDSCSCITIHWDIGTVDEDRDAYAVSIHDNVLSDSNVGIFLSAVHKSIITNNIISNVSYKGIMCYCGDNSYGFSSNIVSNNTIQTDKNDSVGIRVIGGNSTVSPNNVYNGNNVRAAIPLQLSGCFHSIISSNQLYGLEHLIQFDGSCGYSDITGNYCELLASKTMLVFGGSNYDTLFFSNNTFVGSGNNTSIAEQATKTGSVSFISNTFKNCRFMRTLFDTLVVRFCTSEFTFFALSSERNKADIFMFNENNNYYTSPKYLSGTTDERTALPQNSVLPVGYPFYDTSQKKMYIYDGNSNWVALN